jgi:hypothetical protein
MIVQSRIQFLTTISRVKVEIMTGTQTMGRFIIYFNETCKQSSIPLKGIPTAT